ncbi:MAG TPA: SDR family oxidoreductase [Trebonia sp.]|jgi:NAD(P)-dependent dehydrogenase (short-subunit alcohol dehydrogenase family)|nr:SDR family oxidoreductase [Trebonia sp.]
MSDNRAWGACDFSERGILIAGGTSGVGLATAMAFASAGARRLMLVGRDAKRGKDAVDRVTSAHPQSVPAFLSADLNVPGAAEEVIAAAIPHLGRLDVLVNSTVAPYQPTLLHDIPPGELLSVLVQQAAGPMLMSRAAVPVMRAQHGGAIINIASDAVKVPTPGETVIGAAMAAIVTFSRTLALEAKRYGVTVNALTPSLIANTGSYDRAMDREFSKKVFDRIISQAHLGVTEPEDLAAVILFLASPSAAKITGQVISVNGGISVA